MSENALTEISQWLYDSENRKLFGSENIKLDLAIAIANARQSKRLTQKQFAALVGVSQAYISKLESGEANPTIGHIGEILAAAWLRLKFRYTPLLAHSNIPAFKETASPSDYEDRVLDILSRTSSGAADDEYLHYKAEPKKQLTGTVTGGLRW